MHQLSFLEKNKVPLILHFQKIFHRQDPQYSVASRILNSLVSIFRLLFEIHPARNIIALLTALLYIPSLNNIKMLLLLLLAFLQYLILVQL